VSAFGKLDIIAGGDFFIGGTSLLVSRGRYSATEDESLKDLRDIGIARASRNFDVDVAFQRMYALCLLRQCVKRVGRGRASE
jgi:hypothetical protein